MASLDALSIAILFGALLALAGILSSLVALRFGAPLLLVFLLVGMLAGEAGPGGIKFDDVGYAVRRRLGRAGADPVRRRAAHPLPYLPQRAGPAGLLATVGVLVTAALTAPAGVCALGLELDRSAAGRRRRRLDRRRRRVLPAPCPRPAAAAARQRHARGRIRHQRSVRDLPHLVLIEILLLGQQALAAGPA